MKLIVVGFLALAFLVGACGGSASNTPRDTQSPSSSASVPEATKPAVQPSLDVPPTLVPAIQTQVGNRLRITSLGVDAPLQVGQVSRSGSQPTPEGADDVVLYDFSLIPRSVGGVPGEGNAVVFGRNQSATPCKGGTVVPPCNAVFFDLQKATIGMPVVVTYEGQTFDYQVTAVCSMPNNVKFDAVFVKTPSSRLTLMSSIGKYEQHTGAYTHTLIVLAEQRRNPNRPCPEGSTPGLPLL